MRRHLTELKWLVVASVLFPQLAHASPLSEAAAALAPGDWTTLQTPGLIWAGESDPNNNIFWGGPGGATSTAITECDEMRWDGFSRQLFFFGGDHNGPMKFISYSDEDNEWTLRNEYNGVNSLPWMSGTNHGYDNSAIDPDGRRFYHLLFEEQQVYEWNIETEQWSSTAFPPIPRETLWITGACCAAVEVFPDFRPNPSAPAFDALIVANTDGVAYFNLSNRSGPWVRLARADEVAAGTIRSVGEYNPVHKVMVFGGGNEFPMGWREMNLIEADGTVSRLPDAPFTMGINESTLTVDPVSGDYLIFREAEDQMWVYDVVTGDYRLHEMNVPPSMTFQDGENQVVAASLDTLKVNLFITCFRRDRCDVHLYKHAPSGRDEFTPAAPTGLRVM